MSPSSKYVHIFSSELGVLVPMSKRKVKKKVQTKEKQLIDVPKDKNNTS